MTCFRGQSEGPSCTCHPPNPSASSIQYAKVPYLGAACPEPRHQFVVRSKQDNEKQWTLFCFVTTLGESLSLCESWWGGRILAPWANWAFQYSGDSGKVTPWQLHHGSRVWQRQGPSQRDPVARSTLCPHSSAFLDFCPFSEFSELSPLAFYSVNFWHCFRTFLFCSRLISWYLLFESRNADHCKCEVCDTARAHNGVFTKADTQYLVPIAIISLMAYDYPRHSRNSYLMIHLFRCPWCVVFCWDTNLNCLRNTH